MSDYARYLLFYRYCQEMTKIGELPFFDTQEEQEEAARSFIESPYALWIDLYDEDLIVGFLIIEFGENTHPMTDYYIAQAYVTPEHRGKGIMKNAVQNFIKEHGGDYVLFVLLKNPNAEAFWRKIFAEMGYEENAKLPVLKGTLDENVAKQIGFWNRQNKILEKKHAEEKEKEKE